MKNERVLLTCIPLVLVGVMAASAPVYAESRMVVLIDASGSMTTPRDNSDRHGANRFEAAKFLASQRVQEQSGVDSGLKVAVFTFRNTSTLIPATRAHGTTGFIDFNLALDEIEALTTASDVGGSTPLAGAMCLAADALVATDAATQILQVSSDGEENATPITANCHGTLYTGPAPYPTGSWEANVLNYFTSNAPSVTVRVDLFDSSQISLVGPQDAPDPEGILDPQARAFAITASAATGLSPLEEFFTILAQTTGGQLNVVNDDKPLPVSGDLNGDSCADHTDAILVARAFGPLAPPTANGRYDLNADGNVDYNDYLIQLSRITGTCGKDPYVPGTSIVCDGTSQIVIDGQSIEDDGITIDARDSCEIIIKNSLIVSGQDAITVTGNAKVTVDNSIIVGQHIVLEGNDQGVVSAGSSFVRGIKCFQGSSQLIDRGGNVFE